MVAGLELNDYKEKFALKNNTERIARSLKKTMQRCGEAVFDALQKDMDIEAKGVLDVVTAADKASERILSDWVSSELPEDGILAEEGTARSSKSGFTWYVDPLDGTKSCMSKLPYFGISMGQAGNDGISTKGGLYFPAHGEYVFAARGEGAWILNFERAFYPLNKKPFHRPFRESVVALGLTAEYGHLQEKFRTTCLNSIALGSFVYEAYYLVMQADVSAYVHTGATQFDCAAATLIAEEVGYAVSPVDLRKKNIPVVIAKNEEILEQVLAICKFPL